MEVLTQCLPYQGGAIPLRPPCGLVGGLQELLVEDNLYGFHILSSLFHITLHTQKPGLNPRWALAQPVLTSRFSKTTGFEDREAVEVFLVGSGFELTSNLPYTCRPP